MEKRDQWLGQPVREWAEAGAETRAENESLFHTPGVPDGNQLFKSKGHRVMNGLAGSAECFGAIYCASQRLSWDFKAKKLRAKN